MKKNVSILIIFSNTRAKSCLGHLSFGLYPDVPAKLGRHATLVLRIFVRNNIQTSVLLKYKQRYE